MTRQTIDEEQARDAGESSPTGAIISDYLSDNPQSDEHIPADANQLKQTEATNRTSLRIEIPRVEVVNKAATSESDVSDETGENGSDKDESSRRPSEGSWEFWDKPSFVTPQSRRATGFDWFKQNRDPNIVFPSFPTEPQTPGVPRYLTHTKASMIKRNPQIQHAKDQTPSGRRYPQGRVPEPKSQNSSRSTTMRETTEEATTRATPENQGKILDAGHATKSRIPRPQSRPVHTQRIGTTPAKANPTPKAPVIPGKHDSHETLDTSQNLDGGGQKHDTQAQAKRQKLPQALGPIGTAQEINSLRDEISRLEKHQILLEKQVKTAKNNQRTAEEQRDGLEQDFRMLNETFEGLEEELQVTKDEYDKKCEEPERDRQRLKKLKTAFAAYVGKVEQLEHENSQLKEAAARSEQHLREDESLHQTERSAPETQVEEADQPKSKPVDTIQNNESAVKPPLADTLSPNTQDDKGHDVLCIEHDCPFAKKLAELHQALALIRKEVHDTEHGQVAIKTEFEILSHAVLRYDVPEELHELMKGILTVIAWYVSDIQKLNEACEEMEKELSERDGATAKDTEVGRLMGRMENMTRMYGQEIAARDLAIKSKTDIINQLRERNKQAKATNENLHSEISQLKSTLIKKDQEIQTKKREDEETTTLVSELALLKKARDQLLTSALSTTEIDTTTFKDLYLLNYQHWEKQAAEYEDLIARAEEIINTDAHQQIQHLEHDLLKALDQMSTLERSLDTYKEESAQWKDESQTLSTKYKTSVQEYEARIEQLQQEAFAYIKEYQDRIPKPDSMENFWDIKYLQKLVDEAEKDKSAYEEKVGKLRRERDAAYEAIKQMQVEGKKVPKQRGGHKKTYSYPFNEAYYQGAQERRERLLSPKNETDEGERARMGERAEGLRGMVQRRNRGRKEEEELIEKAKKWKMGKWYPPGRLEYRAVSEDVWERWDVVEYLRMEGSVEDNKLAEKLWEEKEKEKARMKEGEKRDR